MALNFAHKSWGRHAPGITVSLICMHGDADAFTSHSKSFPLTEDGKAAAETLIEVLGHLNAAVCKDLEGSVESVCKYLSKKVGLDIDTLDELLDELLFCDVSYDEHFSVPAAFTVRVTDEKGTSWAQYPDDEGVLRCYCKLSNTSDSNLEEWA